MHQITLIDVLNSQNHKEYLCEKEKITYILETYYKRVYNYMYYQVKCYYTAEDLTSQVFQKVMLKINTYSEKKHLLRWYS